MILLKSLIFLLLVLIVAHLIKVYFGKKKSETEGFKVNEINSFFDENIANDLEQNNVPHQALIKRSVQMPPVLGGELAPPVGPSVLPPAQKAQAQAQMEQATEEENTVGKHKEASDEAIKMNYLKGQMDELLKLSNEAKEINENFKNI